MAFEVLARSGRAGDRLGTRARGKYLPIEVKLTDRPSLKDARHLLVFMKEHKAKKGLVICTSPRAVRLNETVTAVPWQDLAAAIGASSA